MSGTHPPLRVALISPTFGSYGGIEAFVLAIMRGLGQASDLELRLVFKRVAGFRLSPELAAAAKQTGGRVQLVARGSAGLLEALWWADVVHLQNASPDVTLAAWVMRRPLLTTMHAHRLPGNSWRQRLWDWSLGRAARRFFVSEFVRRTWEGADVRSGSAVVFPTCELSDEVRPCAQRRGFVFVGRWIENKGIELLVTAYARGGFDPVAWPLILLGDGPLRQTVVQQIETLKVSGISMPGFVSPAAKTAAIRSARWMVVPPNTNEDFGLTAVEARSLGVPCIITRDGGLPEAAGDEALVSEPGSVEGLVANLRAAVAMSVEEYVARAERTRATWQREQVPPAFYQTVYREMAQR